MEYTYDALDRVVGVCYNGIKRTEFVYASNGEISSVTDLANSTTYQYYYDGDGKLINERAIGSSNKTKYNTFYKYGENGEIVQRTIYFPDSVNNNAIIVSYTYNEDGTVSKVTNPNGNENYSYDDFGRMISNSLTVGTSTLISDNYT